MTPTKPTQLKHYVDVTTKHYLYHIKIFTSVPYKTLFSHVKKHLWTWKVWKSLSFITSYICICVVIKAIILGQDLLICQLQSQPSRVSLLFSRSSSLIPTSPNAESCSVVVAFSSLRSCSRRPVTMFSCSLQFPRRCGGILPLFVTGSAAIHRERNRKWV